jgi:hypothetical protein
MLKRHYLPLMVLSACALVRCSTNGDGSGSTLPQGAESFTSSSAGGMRVEHSSRWKVDGTANFPRLLRSGAEIVIITERRSDERDSVQRLKEIEAEWPVRVDPITVNGHPALARVRVAEAPVPSRQRRVVSRPKLTHVTVAVAVGSNLVRVEGTASDPALADEILDVARHVAFVPGASDTWKNLRPSLPTGEPVGQTTQSLDDGDDGEGDDENPPPVDNGPVPSDRLGVFSRVNNSGGNNSEIEVAVSTSGQYIVAVNNSRDYMYSTDYGMTFTQRVDTSGSGADQGDPSISFAASGDFYTAHIRQPDGSAAAGNQTGCGTEIDRSTDNGQNFALRGYAALSPSSGNSVFFPDQEHIAADRTNLSASNEDQVYSVWRDFRPTSPAATDTCKNVGGSISASASPRIMCSTDGGANWGNSTIIGSGDFPRVSVGQDGFVYAVYLNGSNVMLDKFSSCANGLTQQAGFPKTVATGVNGVDCGTIPVPAGLDRCNGNNTLASPTVAIDDSNANHIFVAYANNTAAGSNEDVLLRDSTDGGVTWTRPAVKMNTAVNAHRFMPWLCATSGTAFVSWYDQRQGVANVSNDLTDYYGASASLDGSGNLTQRSELRISQVSDPMCASGWPSTPNNKTSSESCPTQPQLAGACTTTGARCDFSDCAGGGGTGSCQCAAGQTCQAGRGSPKYGDYSGNACANGRFYTVFASATSPAGTAPPSTGIDAYAACPPDAKLDSLSFNDTTPPVISQVPSDIRVGGCGPVALGQPKGYDVCGSPPSFTNDAPASFGPGTTTVTWTAKDAAGNASTATQNVIVVDTIPPVFTFVPPPIAITKCVSASIGQAIATDDCGAVTVTNDAPAKFPIGKTTVTWTATDGAGNRTTATQIVTATLGDDPTCCPNGTHIILGTSGADNLVGTAGSDCILGRNGDDVIDARGGDDFVSGGNGNDTVMAGLGNDLVWGGSGIDTIDGSEGDDFIDGGPDVNICSGGTGVNKITSCTVSSACTDACCATDSCAM